MKKSGVGGRQRLHSQKGTTLGFEPRYFDFNPKVFPAGFQGSLKSLPKVRALGFITENTHIPNRPLELAICLEVGIWRGIIPSRNEMEWHGMEW